MDVSVNPVLESVRPFFQGLPANNSPSPATSVGSQPSHPGAATPVPPAQHGGVPTSSPSVLSYWPPRHAQSPSPALASPLQHHVYNGTKLAEPVSHNLPPVAAYQHSRAASSPHRQPSQFRAPDYPQTNHQSIYSPNPSSNQSHSRSSSSSSSPYQSQVLGSKYQPPSSPAVSSPSPHSYSYSPRTSLPTSSVTTAPSSVYPQTISTTSVYVNSSPLPRQPQFVQPPQPSRPPSNHQLQSHHPVSPVIQQPSQPELQGHLKIHPSPLSAHPSSPYQPAHSPLTNSHLQQASPRLHQLVSPQPQHPQHVSPRPQPTSSQQQPPSGHTQPSTNQSQHSNSDHQQSNQSQSLGNQLQHSSSQSQQASTIQYSSSQPQHSSTIHFSSSQSHPASSQLHYSSSQPQQSSSQQNYASNQPQQSSSQQHYSSSQPQQSNSQQHYSSSQSHHTNSQLHYSSSQQHHYSSSQTQHSNSEPQYTSSQSHYSNSQAHYTSTQPQHSSSQSQLSSSQPQQSQSHHSITQLHHSHTHHQLSSSHPQHSNNHHPNSNSYPQLVSPRTQSSSHLQQSNHYQQLTVQPQNNSSNSQNSTPHQQQPYSQHPPHSSSQHASYQQPHRPSSQQQQLLHHQQDANHSRQQQQHQQQQQQQQQQHHQQQQLTQQQQNQQILAQQHSQLLQQTTIYNQTVQHGGRQSDAEKLAEMQQMLRIKQRQLAVVQAQKQAYYAAASSSNSSRTSSQTTTTTIEATNHQRTTTTQALTVGLKRESPLDLSVKTVRQSADSTAKDDSESLYVQTHEAFQHRSKHTSKVASPRGSAVLPPLQLPSSVIYPHFENHATNQTSGSGMPKVDFLPNFNAHHSSSTRNIASFEDPSKRQRKSVSSQPPNQAQYPHMGSLPHMGSFKKSSLPNAAYDDPSKKSQFHPATGPPGMQRTPALPNNSSLHLPSSYPTASSGQYSFDSVKRGSSSRYDYERRTSTSSLQSTSSTESNYHLGKRQSSSDLRHPLPPKIPKIVDTWRQTIDQQIEQRLNTYAKSRVPQVNGTKDGSGSDSMRHQQTVSPFSSTSSHIQTSHGNATLPSSNSLISRPSLLTSSHRSNSSSKLDLTSQYYPYTQQQYSTHNITPRSTSEVYNNIGQVKLSSLPNNGAADKRVLSILRKRLDTREATNQLVQQQQQQQQLQQQQLQQQSQERAKGLYSRAYPPQLIVPSPSMSLQNKPPSQTPLGRHNLPPFNALNLERNTAMSYANQKLHIPKAMDSVAPEYSQQPSLPRADIIPRSPLPSRTETSGKPIGGENAADFDGLAAFLAARIRTKAELKQVGPSMDQQRTPTPASGSNSSAHSPRTTPGIFSPPPSQGQYPGMPADFGKGTPGSESDRASSSGVSGSSPLKQSKERYSINSPRRRLFGRPEDEGGGGSDAVIRAREAGLRSSSETSVFDFRESDSDGETVSERQSLHEMRRDRDRRMQERQQTLPFTTPGLADMPEFNDTEPIDDSFWSGMCDQFVTQLEKGGNKVRKRGRRKKIVHPPPAEPEPIFTMDQCDKIKSETVTASSTIVPQVESIKLEKEDSEFPTETPNEEVKEVPDKDTPETPPVHLTPPDKIKKEEESSDEDAPLALRQTELIKKAKESDVKREESASEEKPVVKITQCDQPVVRLENIKQEDLKSTFAKLEPKKEISDSEAESSADESVESVAKRLRMRKPKEEGKETRRKTRSSEKENSNTPQGTPKKRGRKKKGEKKKSLFGDGSEFRPGWEAEVYKYKRSLRMPARLINIAGPQSWPRLSVSLPDLDPDSPMTLDSDISLQNEGESTPTKTKLTDSSKNKPNQKKDSEKSEGDSFLNRLVQRYGGKGKKSLRKGQEKESLKERKGPKIIPQTNELQLLPTPSLDSIVKSPAKKVAQNTSYNKSFKGRKPNKEGMKPIDFESPESVYLGYFRKKTVDDFRDAFAKHNGGFATEHELPPIMLKSRTRTQTRILTQRATIREVFGEDRPASAPPAGCRSEESEENKKSLNNIKSKKSSAKNKFLKRNNNTGISPGTRAGLRSAAFLRSNKAVLKSKQQLLHGGERRKRSKYLIKAYTSSKKYHKDLESNPASDMEPVVKLEPLEVTIKEEVPLVNVKRLKYRNVRRKLKSSGFDYIRKKKKQQQKKDGDTESLKEKKKTTPPKQHLESEEDIQNEIKGWVINKGLGETVLHRAARLGYTDIAAYCLERMDHNPSPRDNAGYTPLHEACSKGRLDIARLLLLYGAEVSDSAQGGIRPLHEAVESGCVELVRLLLAYGGDPLLATYSGLTPLSLAHFHPDLRALLQTHLADVQGLSAPPWQIHLSDEATVGCDVLSDPRPPSPEPVTEEVEIEAAELSLPHLYQLLGEPAAERWVLFQELGPVLRVKTREALVRQLGIRHKNDFRDLKMTEFYDMARCCSALGVGDRILNPKAHKVTLVRYSNRVSELLNAERVAVSTR